MRPSFNSVYIRMAKLIAERSTCKRRAVGCVLTSLDNEILSTGYNGVAKGAPHCNVGFPCPGADSPSGTDRDKCYAIHAEQNALVRKKCSPDIIHNCYVTVAPCITCTKLLLQTSCLNIYFVDLYPDMDASMALWINAGRNWIQVDLPAGTYTQTHIGQTSLTIQKTVHIL